MRRISVVFLLFIATGCGSDLKSVYKDHKFDQEVIDKLPVYDSVATLLIRNLPAIREHIKNQVSYRYIDYEDGNDIKLPPGEAAKIKEYFTKLGMKWIFGFEIYKDSTIKIYVRETYLQSERISISDRLSYFPTGTAIKRREFPIKDTILNQNWQYWMVFEQQIVR